MAGWTRYNEESGEIEVGLYERPYIVRGTYDITRGCEAESLAAFRTREEADEFVRWFGSHYLQPGGFDDDDDDDNIGIESTLPPLPIPSRAPRSPRS